MPATHLSESPQLFSDRSSIVDEIEDNHNNHHNHYHNRSSSHDSLIELGGSPGHRDGMGLDRNANQIERVSKKVLSFELLVMYFLKNEFVIKKSVYVGFLRMTLQYLIIIRPAPEYKSIQRTFVFMHPA